MTEKITRTGARTIELLIPFDFMGRRIEFVNLGPICLDHTIRWREAKFNSWFDLMHDMASIDGKPCEIEMLRQLRYPDADRVIEGFIEMLPPEIRVAIRQGSWPNRELVDPTAAFIPPIPPSNEEELDEGQQPDGMDVDN